MHTTTTFITLALAALSAAKTDIGGCTSSATTNQWGEASMIWWVPGTGEICEFLDCGGGRAPPKTNVPGCAAYKGTETYKPSYMPGWGPDGQIATPKSTPVEVETPEQTPAYGEESQKPGAGYGNGYPAESSAPTAGQSSEYPAVTSAPAYLPTITKPVTLITATGSGYPAANGTASYKPAEPSTSIVEGTGAGSVVGVQMGVMALVGAAAGLMVL
ncbi:uncharacterized protein EI97DRAFT_441243 [Westerdykella ornata]|uniref:Siderophore biosynthesis enzyme n=1 Tax=Westerdykella ornata TaxID=318751 RepID=A0A6A6JSK2_WESOR|nr:uncharacterized protein EI97DRAFT_441243 [Westerdykella ornata]KAF2277959.1 hypothetical protein EI97DRAFT_441243 [Westerdykella ornata]